MNEFINNNTPTHISNAQFTCSAPSNIALVKYWGKKDNQIPANPSLSFTLQHCKTITEVHYSQHQKGATTFEIWLNNEIAPSFAPKIQQFLDRIAVYCPYLSHYHLDIRTQNTFPHSSGIASSASGMAALSYNIMCLEKQLFPTISETYFYQKASFLARLGSGSACRSIAGKVVVWGNHEHTAQSNDFFGTDVTSIVHPVFQNYQDTILLVDKGEKQVSSTVGHGLMENHPFAQQRFAQAHQNLQQLQQLLADGNLEAFVALVESEALTLHAMMMTSMPYFILMKPNTMAIIERIWAYRKSTQIPVCFTLDAGANVHVLYPEKHKDEILQFIKNELVGYCQNGQYICDEIGTGTQIL